MVDLEGANVLLWRAKEKRKWQIALRRYVFKENKAVAYAPYFGIDAAGFRDWIALQFSGDLHWDSFSTKWQFGHVLPMTYFDFTSQEDLRLCWSFVNVRVEPVHSQTAAEQGLGELKGGDLLNAKLYFQQLYAQSQSEVVRQLLEKIEAIESAFVVKQSAAVLLGGFLMNRSSYLQKLASFDANAFLKLNDGVALEEILAEQQLLARFG